MNKKGKMGRKIVFLGLAPKCWSRVIFSTGVNQNLGVPQCLRAAPKCWYVFSFLAFLHKNTEKHIATNVWSAKHPNPGQMYNTRYIGLIIR